VHQGIHDVETKGFPGLAMTAFALARMKFATIESSMSGLSLSDCGGIDVGCGRVHRRVFCAAKTTSDLRGASK